MTQITFETQKEEACFRTMLHWFVNDVFDLENRIKEMPRPVYYNRVDDKRAILVERRNKLYNDMLDDIGQLTGTKPPFVRPLQENIKDARVYFCTFLKALSGAREEENVHMAQ